MREIVSILLFIFLHRLKTGRIEPQKDPKPVTGLNGREIIGGRLKENTFFTSEFRRWRPGSQRREGVHGWADFVAPKLIFTTCESPTMLMKIQIILYCVLITLVHGNKANLKRQSLALLGLKSNF